MPVIPSSVQQRLSSMQVLTRAIDSSNVNVQLVIPPSTRQVWVGMRQNAHDIRMDREEMGNASVEIDELGLIQPAPLAGAPATRPFGWTNFQLRCGTASAPNIPYANLDARSGKYSRVFNDALSVCGKPNGLRGTEWSFDEFCGQTSANGVVYGAAAAVCSMAALLVGATVLLLRQLRRRANFRAEMLVDANSLLFVSGRNRLGVWSVTSGAE